MRVSFERGFTKLVESRQQKHLGHLIAELTDYYENHQEWQSLSNDKKMWLNILWQVNDHRHPHPPPWIKEALLSKNNIWPPKWQEQNGRKLSGHNDDKLRLHHLVPLEMRVMLLDADKNLR